MTLLTAGYWSPTFWTENFWQDDYWQKYGAAFNQAAVRQTLLITARTKALLLTARTKALIIGDL